MSDELTNPNPTYADELQRRNMNIRNNLRGHVLPESRIFTHVHVAVRSNMVDLLFFRTDQISHEKQFERIAIPYDHFLLVARGIVDAHDESESLAQHNSSEE